MPRAKREEAPAREQLISTILGMVIVVVVGLLAYSHFQKKEEEVPVSTEPIEESQAEKTVSFEVAESLPTVYKVQAKDHLWKIAERFYRSGYNWVDIVQENNLKNPNLIFVGQELKIPDVKPRVVTVATTAPIKPGKYTVQKGDWLSKIALRAYGDMFAWEKIYNANKTTIGDNPHLIEVGMVLTIPE